MSSTRNSLISALVMILGIVWWISLAQPAAAGVDIPWSTTYDCSDWTQQPTLSCSDLIFYGGWTCNGQGEEITAAANNPAGPGGKGQRHWKGDGQNLLSGGTQLKFNTPQREIWIRWYMRYQRGFKWNFLGYEKMLYLDNSTVPEFAGWDQLNIGAGPTPHFSNSGGWDTVMKNGEIDPATGHRTSDGQFHCYEVHLKNDGPSGVAEFWIDGVKHLSYDNINFGTDFSYVIIGSNENNPNNGGCSYVDFDDIAINNAGYIGPILSR